MVEEGLGFLLAAGAAVLFGISRVFTRRGLLTTDVPVGILVSLMPTIPLVLASNLLLGEPPRPLILQPEVLLLIIATAVLNVNLGRWLVYSSIKLVGAARASQIVALEVPFTAFFGAVLLGETLSVRVAIGTVIVFLGILFVALSRPSASPLRSTSGRDFGQGVALALAGAVLWSLAFITARVSAQGWGSPVAAALLSLVLATLIQGIIVAGLRGFPVISKVNRGELSALLASGATTGIATLLYFSALRSLPVVLASPILNLSPLVATVLSFLLIQKMERVNRMVVLATLLVATGSYLVITST